ncbi:M60 family metallopeptidase [Streptomyces sp. NPDC004296]|uniref:M60 family metallopeptidase n=1 Tax=Streptomyces sp. NPDC004296 TaxID=3364697 RepID=UPI0036CADDA4
MITRTTSLPTVGVFPTVGLLAAGLLASGCSAERIPQQVPSPSQSSARVITLAATPSSAAEQKRLATEFHPDDAQPTGLYLPPHTLLTVTSDRPGNAPIPELLVGTYGLDGTDSGTEAEPRTHKLQDATTEVTDGTGGMLYVRYTKDGGDPAPEITLHFGASAHSVPYHVLGRTPAAQWKSQLDQAAKDVPVAQLVADHVVLTVHLDSARRNRTQNPDDLLRRYEHILATEDAISGLDGRDPRDRRSPLRYFVSEGKAGINPNAYYDRVCYPSDLIDEALNVDALNESWGMWHELGHMHQQSSWMWDAVTEVTVNVYSLAVQRDAGQPTRLGKDGTPVAVRTYLDGSATRPAYDAKDGDPFVRLAMFEQLRLAFGDGFYPELHKLTRRAETATDPEQYLVLNASRVSGHDLISFFSAWGVPVTAQTRAEVAALGLHAPDEDPSALDVGRTS